jgi:hypothetical protein
MRAASLAAIRLLLPRSAAAGGHNMPIRVRDAAPHGSAWQADSSVNDRLFQAANAAQSAISRKERARCWNFSRAEAI